MDSRAVRTGWILVVFGSVLMLYVAINYALSAAPFFPVPLKWIGFAARQIFPVAAASAVAIGGMLLYRWQRGPRVLRVLGILMIAHYAVAYVWLYVSVLLEITSFSLSRDLTIPVAGILYTVGASIKLQELSRARISDSDPKASQTDGVGPYPQEVDANKISSHPQALSVSSVPQEILVSQRPRSRSSVAVIIVAAIVFAGISILGGSSIMKEQAIKNSATKGLEEKYGEKFVVLGFETDRGIPFLPDDSYNLVCAPASNKELIFSAYSVGEDDDDPLEYYVERVAAEDCKRLIKPTIDKIASNYVIKTNADFSKDDIDVSRWDEFATAEYAVRSKGEISSYIFIDSSSTKGLGYGEEYDLLTEMIDSTFPTEFSLSIWLEDINIVKECDEYIAHNLPTWEEYKSILGEDALSDASIYRNGYLGLSDTTREEYIKARETGHQIFGEKEDE